ncbi:hypothetical protein DM49_2365 [Burkholderia mallei]|nr:hypothetical protein DM46_867 [Burkholderia mallei]KOS94763.1 hypothetical protein DM49_2365 [Burkholderia mallei]KOS99718.1 hypothetical protein DM50_1901 [Burkholderia mallei]KOT06040.1 hypothetical protein DM77_1312 [Burkholderia mallei]KOT20080.1 hypothetical protein DM52_882 [Burkholderia mallei]
MNAVVVECISPPTLGPLYLLLRYPSVKDAAAPERAKAGAPHVAHRYRKRIILCRKRVF